jgi:hypothetical protein
MFLLLISLLRLIKLVAAPLAATIGFLHVLLPCAFGCSFGEDVELSSVL